MKKFALCLALLSLSTLTLNGCNATADATNAVNVINQLIKVAQTDLPALCSTNLLTPTECTSVGNGLTGAANLGTQATSCVSAVATAGGKKAAFLSCFNTFSAGLLSPAELTLFRVVNPTAQKTVETWVIAITLAVNGILTIVGGTPAPLPTVASISQPTRAEAVAWARNAGIEVPRGF